MYLHKLLSATRDARNDVCTEIADANQDVRVNGLYRFFHPLTELMS